MKRILFILFCLMLGVLLLVGLAACDNAHKHTVVIDAAVEPTDTTDGFTEGKHCSECGEVLVKQEVIPAWLKGTDIKSKRLAVKSDTIVGAVSNATETFSFLEDLTLASGADFVLAEDKDCLQTIQEKSVSLQIGDNTYYVLVTNGDAQKLYTVTLRRRPMCTVSFSTGCAAVFDDQIVEEGGLATKPTSESITRKGYTLAGWSCDFTKPIMGNVCIEAIWTPNRNTRYTVEHYRQNIDGSYALAETEELAGTTDTTITAAPKNFEHFTFDDQQNQQLSGVINCDGTLLLKVYYKRNVYGLTNANSDRGSIEGGGTYVYDDSKMIVATATDNVLGYEFLGWYSGETCLSTDKVYTYTVDKNVEARFGVRQEMQNFEFISTATTCIITNAYNIKITELFIPQYVTSISADILKFFGWLEAISVQEGNTAYHVQGNCLIETASKTLVRGCKTSVIPNDGSVTSIGKNAFGGCGKLESITLSNSLISIGDGAFLNCKKLAAISLPSSVKIMDRNVFWGCASLLSITIPASVTQIGDTAFSGCKALQTVTFDQGSKLELIGAKAFSGCIAIAAITLPDSAQYFIEDNAFKGCSGLVSIEISAGVKDIGKAIFEGCGALTSIYFLGTEEQWNEVSKVEDEWDPTQAGSYKIASFGGNNA